MNAFDKVIGYETIKEELLQICDMIHNRDVYKKLGAKLPQGVLLIGDPGLGKTLMAKCFIEECGIQAFTVRRNKGNDDFIGNITETFKKAKESAPSIVFLDDMDKFANEDDDHCDAEEYVAVQAGIDEVKDGDVFVLATVNEPWKLPNSLVRQGRFDRRIEVHYPSDKDSQSIIEHYLSTKAIADGLNIEDLSKMISHCSCAELETILNEAAVFAGYQRKDCIDMDDLVRAVLRSQYHSPDNFTMESAEELVRVAAHEAGHLVVCEVLEPNSVGLASLRSRGRDSTGGFIHRCKDSADKIYDVIVSLGGKAATELFYPEINAKGNYNDIERAYRMIRDSLYQEGSRGFGMVDVACHRFPKTSEGMNASSEAVAQAELERYQRIAKSIILDNRDFFEKIKSALVEKETLLYSEIQAIKVKTEIKKNTLIA